MGLLRVTAGQLFNSSDGASTALPGGLWYEKRKDWLQLAQVLGEFDQQRGHFRPRVEPDQFRGEDDLLVHAAAEILRLYLWSSENHPDFQAIRERFKLPNPQEVKGLLRTYDFSGG